MNQFKSIKLMFLLLDSFIYKSKSLCGVEIRDNLIMGIIKFIHQLNLDTDIHTFINIDLDVFSVELKLELKKHDPFGSLKNDLLKLSSSSVELVNNMKEIPTSWIYNILDYKNMYSYLERVVNKYSADLLNDKVFLEKIMNLKEAYEYVIQTAFELRNYCSSVLIIQSSKPRNELESYLYRGDRLPWLKWVVISFKSCDLIKMFEIEKILSTMDIHFDTGYDFKTRYWLIDWSFHVGNHKPLGLYLLLIFTDLGESNLLFGNPIKLKETGKYQLVLKNLEAYIREHTREKISQKVGLQQLQCSLCADN